MLRSISPQDAEYLVECVQFCTGDDEFMSADPMRAKRLLELEAELFKITEG
ncbi:MAG: hypothetical protein PHI12_07425 [Dehalococcoidales bacterium]|nr:hypothetical protein [Dehalococcoidales bacterium]